MTPDTILVNTIVGIVKDVGFPIFVALYLLVVMRREARAMTDALKEVTLCGREILDIIKQWGPPPRS